MTVFDARRVAAQQAGALFQVALAEVLAFAEFPKSLTNDHGREPTMVPSKPPLAGDLTSEQAIAWPPAKARLRRSCPESTATYRAFINCLVTRLSMLGCCTAQMRFTFLVLIFKASTIPSRN